MSDAQLNAIPDTAPPSVGRRLLKWGGTVLLGLLLLVLILGVMPVSLAGLESSSSPAGSYEEAVGRFAAIKEEEAAIVNDASGSLLLAHGEATEEVYVLIHGTTNSPRQWEELGGALHALGHNVLILRMPHHGLESRSVGELKAL